jgi:isoquinoline 1-oxidoreductase alpha subunit
MLVLSVNGRDYPLEDADPATPLLWVLRDALNLVGTKYGCGIGVCGTCTVLLDGQPARACTLTAAAVAGRRVTTIEGLASPNGELHPLQAAWIEEDVPQCGFCQAGQIMSAAALLKANPAPSDAEIDEALAGNLCRCGTYLRIRKAVHNAARRLAGRREAAS